MKTGEAGRPIEKVLDFAEAKERGASVGATVELADDGPWPFALVSPPSLPEVPTPAFQVGAPIKSETCATCGRPIDIHGEAPAASLPWRCVCGARGMSTPRPPAPPLPEVLRADGALLVGGDPFVPLIVFESIDGPCETARSPEDVQRIAGRQHPANTLTAPRPAPQRWDLEPWMIADFMNDPALVAKLAARMGERPAFEYAKEPGDVWRSIDLAPAPHVYEIDDSGRIISPSEARGLLRPRVGMPAPPADFYEGSGLSANLLAMAKASAAAERAEGAPLVNHGLLGPARCRCGSNTHHEACETVSPDEAALSPAEAFAFDLWKQERPLFARLPAGAGARDVLRLAGQRLANMNPRAKLPGPDGAEVEISKGSRVSWRNPGGLGGITVTGKIQGIQVDEHGDPRVAAIDVDPSAELRALVVAMGISAEQITVRTGLDGNGGLVLLTGEGFSSAVHRGDLLVLELEKGTDR